MSAIASSVNFLIARYPLRKSSQDDAHKDWRAQAMAAPPQRLVLAVYTHAGVRLQRECSYPFIPQMCGECGTSIFHATFERSSR